MMFNNKIELADYLSWLIDTDTELQDDDGVKEAQCFIEPGENIFFISCADKKVYKITVEEHGKL